MPKTTTQDIIDRTNAHHATCSQCQAADVELVNPKCAIGAELTKPAALAAIADHRGPLN